MRRLFVRRFRKRRRESDIDIGAWCRIQAQFRWKYPDGDMPCRSVFHGEVADESELDDPERKDQWLGKFCRNYDSSDGSRDSANVRYPDVPVDVTAGRIRPLRCYETYRSIVVGAVYDRPRFFRMRNCGRS